MTQSIQEAFAGQKAKRYDADRARLAPIKDVLHLVTDAALTELPETAHVLGVGVGTGTELLYLAERHPGWRFTAVEPSGDMLAVCKKAAESAGIAERCTFHEGFLNTLPEGPPFDAAICLLVSHFIIDRSERVDFFRQIGARLIPRGHFVNAGLAADLTAPGFDALLEVWVRILKGTGMPTDSFREIIGRRVAVLPPTEVAQLLTEAGFAAPTDLLHILLMRAWHSRLA